MKVMAKKTRSSRQSVSSLLPEEEKEIISWQALSRPYRPRDKDFWVTTIASAILIIAILVFVGEFGAIAVIIAALFCYYALTSVKPEEVDYRLTTKGVYCPPFKERIDWDLFHSFSKGEKWGYPLLRLYTYSKDIPEVSLVLEKNKKEKIYQIVARYLNETPEKETFAEKITAWFYQHLPFEGGKNRVSKS